MAVFMASVRTHGFEVAADVVAAGQRNLLAADRRLGDLLVLAMDVAVLGTAAHALGEALDEAHRALGGTIGRGVDLFGAAAARVGRGGRVAVVAVGTSAAAGPGLAAGAAGARAAATHRAL